MDDGKIIVCESGVSENRFVADSCQCAIDFGTTYSGVAYAYVEKDQDVSPPSFIWALYLLTFVKPSDVSIELIEDHWPGMGSQSSPKVPSFVEPDP